MYSSHSASLRKSLSPSLTSPSIQLSELSSGDCDLTSVEREAKVKIPSPLSTPSPFYSLSLTVHRGNQTLHSRASVPQPSSEALVRLHLPTADDLQLPMDFVGGSAVRHFISALQSALCSRMGADFKRLQLSLSKLACFQSDSSLGTP